jgi:dipeptidyl-peptidase 4
MKRALLLSLLLACPVLAQEPRPPHPLFDLKEMRQLAQPDFLREYAETRGYLLGRPVKPKITPQGRVLFLRSEAKSRSQSLYQWDPAARRERLLLSPEQLLAGRSEKISAEEKARNERKRQLGTGFTEYFVSPDGNRLLLPLSGGLYVYDFAHAKTRKLPISGSVIDPQWSPDGRRVAYVRNYDVWVYDLTTGREIAATQGGTVEKTHGVAEFVAQEEMRRLSGYVWAPDSQGIAFEEADHRGVEVWHISDPMHPENPPQQQYYPRPGKRNVRARVGVVRLGNPQVTWVRWGPGVEYLAGMKWHVRGGLTLQLQDRLQHLLRLVRVNPANGSVATLLEERHPQWVPLHQKLPVWLEDGKRFVFVKRRGDHQALCLWDKGAVRFLDPEQDYDLSEVVGYSPAADAVLLRVDRGPGDPELHWVAVGGKAPVAPPLDGVQEAEMAKNSTAVVVSQQSDEEFPRLVYVPPTGPVQPLPGQGVEPTLTLRTQFETVKAEGREYRTVWMTPRDFQPGRRYPVIVDVYGGPTKIQVAHNKRAWLVDQWLADQGFIVVGIDNRGTPGRGRAWETAVYGKFDEVPLHDQETALRALGALHPEFDLERVGIWGWSFGGYVSAQAVLRRPEFFKAAVAGAPVTDWADYDTHYTERYLGTPQRNPQAYEQSNLLNHASSLTRPLLLVHGTADDNVYYRHSLKLADALFRAGQNFELLTLPGITHSYRADVEVTQQLWTRIVGFFRKNLGGPENAAE